MNGVGAQESVSCVNEAVSVSRRLRLGYAVFAVCGSGILLYCCSVYASLLIFCFAAGQYLVFADSSFFSVLLGCFWSAVVFLGFLVYQCLL